VSGKRVTTHRDLLLDYFKKNFLFWPVFWLALGAGALALLAKARESAVTSDCARALITSGLLYAGAYFFVSVATETRYYYWSIMAIMLGIIVGYTEIASQARAHPSLRRMAVALIAVVLIAGLVARIADIPLL
jgi:hypothetical protein